MLHWHWERALGGVGEWEEEESVVSVEAKTLQLTLHVREAREVECSVGGDVESAKTDTARERGEAAYTIWNGAEGVVKISQGKYDCRKLT